MSEKETLGMTEQVAETRELSPSEKAKKKKAKYTMAKIIVVFCVILCVVLTVFQMSATYRFMKAVEVDGTEYSVAEYNWLYTNSVYEVYNSYYQNYGELALYFFNPQGNLEEQIYDQETGKTWAENMAEYTDNTFVEMTKLYDEGKAAGFELDESYLETIDNEWASLEEVAKSSGFNANDYAEMNYGRGVNEKVFREMYERYYFAFAYAEHYSGSLEFTSEDIDAHYSENKESFDRISYNVFFASGAAEEGEDADAAMADAKAEAEKAFANSDEAEFTEYNNSLISETNPLYMEWLSDSARKAGDKELFESESGYYVVEFVEVCDLHYNTVNVRHILVPPTDTANEMAWQEALKKAEEYDAEWKALGGSEDNFAEVAASRSADSSSIYGGLIENIAKGVTVPEFDAWSFDPARKAGDTEIIKTDYGYHVMYFSGVGEEFYTFTVENALRGEKLNSYIDGIIEGVEVNELFGDRFSGKHLA